MTEDEINAVLSKLQFNEPEADAPRSRLSDVSLSRPRIDESFPVTLSPSRESIAPMASSMMSMVPSATGRASVPAFGGELSVQGGYLPIRGAPPVTHHGFSFEKRFADGGHVDAALHLLRQHFDEGGFLDSLRSLFSGDDYQSTGDKVVKDGEVNWGNPELAADFFRADKARMALDKRPAVGRPEDDVTGSVPMPRPRPAPETPAVKIPFEAPKAGFELPSQLAPEREPIFPYTGFRAVPPGFAMPSPVAPDLPAPRAAPDVRPMAYAPATGAAQAPALQAISTATSPLDIRDISHLSQYRGSAMENPQAVVFHHTAGEGTPEGVVNTLNTRKDPFTGRPMILGAHYIIDRDGSIHSALPPGTRGAHIMPSKINDLSNYNTYGVEVIAKDNNDITPEQIAAGQRLYTHLSAGRSEPLGVFGHGELNPGHKLPDEGLAIVNPIRTAAAPASATDAAVDTARKVTNRAVNYPELSADDKDLIAKTIAAEASGKSPEEAHAIANVILNRAIAGGRYGKSIRDILFAENQFEPWSDESKENYPMKFKPGMKAYDAGAEALQKAYDAGDITGGSTYFWAPGAQGRLGRNVPKFARDYPGFNIGATRFHRETREEGGEVEGYAGGGDVVKQALAALRGGNKVFPKPQRMFPADARPPGGEYINAATGEAMTGQKPARAVLGVTPEGKPVFLTDPEQVDVTGSPGKGSTKTMTNLFRRSAGWDWRDAPEGYENVPMIVSTKNRNKHYYSLGADYPKGVDLARYPNETSEPRLKPTTQGNVYPGEQVGTIVNKTTGDEHPVYDMVTIRNLLAGTGAGAAGAAAIPDEARLSEASGGKTVSKALKAVSELFDSPGMTQWREKSVIPASKVEDRYFTGTSKDKDFPSFNVGRHGAWFTKDPAEASSYAKENDSKGFKAEGWKMVPVNTADRVIPAYLRAENPFTGPRPESMLTMDNYKKAQSDWFDQLRAQGHDAWMPESAPNLAVILKEPSQIKSAISNSGDFDLNAPRTDRDAGGEVNDALRVVREHHADGEAVGQAPFFTFEPTPDSIDRQAARQPAYNPAERTWSDAGSTEGERLTRALGVEGELPKGETFMSAAPTGWDKYMPQRRPGSYLKRWGEAFDENAKDVREGWKDAKEGNYAAGALGMLGGVMGAGMAPLTAAERVLVRDPYLRITGNLKDAQAAEMVADAALTGGMRGPAKQLLGKKSMSQLAVEPLTSAHRLPSPAATGAATAAAATLAPEDAEAGNVERILRGLRAYHGSPYKFDRFDLSKIGAGEGAQAFGHGLYFAEHEPTAKYYRDTLAHKGAIDLEQAAHERGLPLSIDAQREIRRQASGSMEPLAAAKWAQSANSEMRPFDREKLADLIDTYRQSRTGHMYEVNINADPDRLLNWNKQLKEQPEGVVRSLQDRGLINMDENIGPSSAGVVRPLGWTENVGGLSGEKLYRRLIENQLAGFDRKGAEALASKELASAGVPGIKYLDAGSLNATGIPTHNYVIFDDKLIDINRRYAEGGQIPEGNDMRDHFESGGLKLVNKLANTRAKIGHNNPPVPRIFPEMAERYPLTKEPVEAFDKKKGEYYLAKDLTPEALAIQKARKAAQATIDKGDYTPFFAPEKRFDVDPTKYPDYTPTTSVLTKKPATQAKYDAIAGSPEASTRLDEAYARGLQQQKDAENWYFMGQLEKHFIEEYGPELGPKMFKQRFADPMAATTGGADPTSNLMMAHYGNYLKEQGLPVPEHSYEYPFPIGGRYAAGNMDQYRKMIMEGQGITHDNPKRYNFSYNFTGHKGPTIDEQMSQMFDPKMNMPPAGTYGHYENALANRAANAGVDPRYFQEVAWAGKKDADSKAGFKAQPMIGIVNEAIERTHQITGMPRDEIVRRGLVRAEIPLYGAAGATAAGAVAPELMQGQGEAPAPAAEAPMTEERKRGGSIVDRALMLVSKRA